MIQLNKKLIVTTFCLIILAEALSFVTFLHPGVNPWVFEAVALAALALTVWKLEWGVYLVFAELVIGSFGKLFVIQFGGIELSIRVVLWLIVLSVWLAHVVKTRRIAFFHSQFFKPYLALAIVLTWGIVWGWARANDFGDMFFDVNNYLYFLLIFPVYEVLAQKRDATLLSGGQVNRVFTILTAAIAWLSIKTIVLFYIFSHELFGLQDVLYAWSRKFQLVEITSIGPTVLASRVFMQSQVWILFGLFVAFSVILNGAKPARGWLRSRVRSLAMTVLLSAAIIMSLSRSFWLAAVVSLALLVTLLLFVFRERILSVLRFSGIMVGVIALGVSLTLGVANFPIPAGSSGSSVITERATKFSGEAAASSRYSQIRPLLTAIAKHPAIGSGFGQAVTYQSKDPRVLKSHPDGWYTTTAFELGWLEVWLKLGLVGLGAYLYLLWRILKAGWQRIKATRIYELHPYDPNKNSEHSDVHSGHLDRYMILGALVGLIAIIITHGVSPYLNHPLGIGVVMLVTALVDKEN